MFEIIVVPYRDESFLTKYGPIVRDWHMILGLATNDLVRSISIINRPNPPFLDYIRKKKGIDVLNDVLGEKANKIKFISSLSFDLSWIYKKRLWTIDVYKNIVRRVIRDNKKNCNTDVKTIVLDFTPMAKMPFDAIDGDTVLYWYDMIDNFSKHNRFTFRERLSVKAKYKYLESRYEGFNDFITCVAPGCQNEISSARILTNGLVNYANKHVSDKREINRRFDFGFCGFVTNKFDVNFIKYLCGFGYSVVIWGDCYSTETMSELERSGATLMGRFTYKDFGDVFSSFKVGIVPYIKQLSHDESPLKIYEYLRNGASVLSLIRYEVNAKNVYYHENEYPSKSELENIIADFNIEDHMSELNFLLNNSSWDFKINNVLTDLWLTI